MVGSPCGHGELGLPGLQGEVYRGGKRRHPPC
jgi:hypothetical protein